MNDQSDIAPIQHGAIGATANTAAGAAGGALKGGAKAWLGWVVGLAVVGALVGGAIPALIAGGSTLGVGVSLPLIISGLATAVNAVWGVVTSGWFIGAAIFAGIGVATGAIPAMIGAGVGALGGGKHAAERVGMENAASAQMQAQMDVYKTQAMAEAMQAEPAPMQVVENKYNLPPYGSAMNPAGPVLSSVQRDGALASRNLQVA